MNRPRTKFVATLGPACATPEVLPKLLEAGVSVLRLNFSHGTEEQRLAYLKVVREVVKDHPVAIMGDLCGPKIRIGAIENNAMPIKKGDVVTIQRETIVGKDYVISSNYDHLIDDLEVGQRVLIDDGNVRMIVVEKQQDLVRCQITLGTLLQSNKGLNLPNTQVALPSVTKKDWHDIDFAIEQGLDYVALSFVRTASEIEQVKQYIKSRGANIGVVSKVEKPQAVDDLDSIIAVSDVVLVARGDLGVEMDLTAVPVIQKRIVSACHEAGKPVIVATQMLQSMVDNATPTRAEVSDVANAILDGADACMLSGETAVGKYPVGAVLVLQQIAEQTEEYIARNKIEYPAPKILQKTQHRTAAIAHGCKTIVEDLNAKMVVVWSQAGGSARYLSKNRMGVPIMAFSTDSAAVRRMSMFYGVKPFIAELPKHFDDLPAMINTLLLKNGYAHDGDKVVIVAGAPLGIVGVTNSLSVHTVITGYQK